MFDGNFGEASELFGDLGKVSGVIEVLKWVLGVWWRHVGSVGLNHESVGWELGEGLAEFFFARVEEVAGE